MNPKIEIVCADPAVGRKYLAAMEQCCPPEDVLLIMRAADDRRRLGDPVPSVVLLDESAVKVSGAASLASAAAALSESAPVVVVGAPESQSALAVLVASGVADFVVRNGHFASIAAGLIEHRLHSTEPASSPRVHVSGLPEDFGEILRHEVNNPLTGILGNAELLLARPEGLSPAAIARVETIAELAVRLRETVRRLSSSWTEDRVGSS